MKLLSSAFLEEKESVEKLGKVNNGLAYTFSFLNARNAEKPYPICPITTKAK